MDKETNSDKEKAPNTDNKNLAEDPNPQTRQPGHSLTAKDSKAASDKNDNKVKSVDYSKKQKEVIDERANAFKNINTQTKSILMFEEQMRLKKEEKARLKEEEEKKREEEFIQKQIEAKKKREEHELEKKKIEELREMEEEEKLNMQAKKKEETFKYFELRKEWSALDEDKKKEKTEEIVAELKNYLGQNDFEKVLSRFEENLKIGISVLELSKVLLDHCQENLSVDLATSVVQLIEENEEKPVESLVEWINSRGNPTEEAAEVVEEKEAEAVAEKEAVEEEVAIVEEEEKEAVAEEANEMEEEKENTDEKEEVAEPKEEEEAKEKEDKMENEEASEQVNTKTNETLPEKAEEAKSSVSKKKEKKSSGCCTIV